ncbi:hypothetical protein D3C86_2077940 [compost metagenome]
MSNVMVLAKPSFFAKFVAATIPPAGPLRRLSLARKPLTSARLPVLVITCKLPPGNAWTILVR